MARRRTLEKSAQEQGIPMRSQGGTGVMCRCRRGKFACRRSAAGPAIGERRAILKQRQTPVSLMPGHIMQAGYQHAASQAVLTGKSEGYSGWRHALYRLRRHAGEVLENIFPQKEASVLKAMLLGEKKGMDSEIKALYQGPGFPISWRFQACTYPCLGWALPSAEPLFITKAVRPSFPAAYFFSYLVMTGFSASAAGRALCF